MSRLRVQLVIGALGLSLAALVLPWRPALADVPAMLNLSAFDPRDEGAAIPAGYDAVAPIDDYEPVFPLPETNSVAYRMSAPAMRRFYVTGIFGGSFLVFAPNNSPPSCLTAGAAAGTALERSNGQIRLEAEGRYRGPIDQKYLGFNENYGPRDPNPVGIVEARNLGGWSVLANVWRDFRLTDQFDFYGGGGIGATGFDVSFQQIETPGPVTLSHRSGYAWQVGVGGIWNVSERVAVDASYRIFGTGWSVTREAVVAGFPRNEILLSLRMYEPFRGFLR
jgi:hypothetical protein